MRYSCTAGTCDVCSQADGAGISQVDVTALAQIVVSTVEELNNRNIQKDVEAAVAQLNNEVCQCLHELSRTSCLLGCTWSVTNCIGP